MPTLATFPARTSSFRASYLPVSIARQLDVLRAEEPMSRLELSAVITSRFLDLLVAIPGVALLALVFVALGGLRFQGRWRLGKDSRTFPEWSWANSKGVRGRILRRLHLTQLPQMWNLLAGQISLVGPRLNRSPSTPVEKRTFRECRRIAPGLLSLYTVRQLANIHFVDEVETELEFVKSYSATSVLGVLARYLVVRIYGTVKQTANKEVHFLGIRIDNLLMSEAVDWISNRIRANSASTAQVSFVNAHCANIAGKDQEYRRVLDSSDLVLADGIGMKVAGTLLNRPIAQNVNGTDMLPSLCSEAGRLNGSIYLLGGEPGVAARVASWISKNYPAVRIAGARSGFFPESESDSEVAAIRAAKPDLLLVAMGVPRQEQWIAQHLEACGARVAIGVGGLFDFYSERIPRAPQWLREIGLEWTYRLYQEPGRMWQRYLVGNFVFIYRIVLEKFHALPSLQEMS